MERSFQFFPRPHGRADVVARVTGECRAAAWLATLSMLVGRLIEGWAARPSTPLAPMLAWAASQLRSMLATIDPARAGIAVAALIVIVLAAGAAWRAGARRRAFRPVR